MPEQRYSHGCVIFYHTLDLEKEITLVNLTQSHKPSEHSPSSVWWGREIRRKARAVGVRGLAAPLLLEGEKDHRERWLLGAEGTPYWQLGSDSANKLTALGNRFFPTSSRKDPGQATSCFLFVRPRVQSLAELIKSFVLCCWVCGSLLQRPWKANTCSFMCNQALNRSSEGSPWMSYWQARSSRASSLPGEGSSILEGLERPL